jgi:hypothetical protein
LVSVSVCEELYVANWLAISLASLPTCPGIHTPGIDGSLILIWNLSGSCQGLDGCLAVEKNIVFPTCVALYYILHCTSVNGIYFSLEYHGVKPKTEAVPHLEPHMYSPSPVPLLSLDLSVYQLYTGLNPILPLILVGELDHEWLVVCISQKHLVQPCL